MECYSKNSPGFMCTKWQEYDIGWQIDVGCSQCVCCCPMNETDPDIKYDEEADKNV